MLKVADIVANLKRNPTPRVNRAYLSVYQLYEPCDQICVSTWKECQDDKGQQRLKNIDHYHTLVYEDMEHDRKIHEDHEDPLNPEMKVRIKTVLSKKMIILNPQSYPKALILPEMGEKDVFFSIYTIETICSDGTIEMCYKICEGNEVNSAEKKTE
jgi:hypothetical protein